MSFPLETAVNGGRMDSSLVSDRIREYVQRVQSRPAYIRALAKGPDYKYGKLELVIHPCPLYLSHAKLISFRRNHQARRTSYEVRFRDLPSDSVHPLCRYLALDTHHAFVALPACHAINIQTFSNPSFSQSIVQSPKKKLGMPNKAC